MAFTLTLLLALGLRAAVGPVEDDSSRLRTSIPGGLWDWITGLDLNTVGFVVVGMFVVTWAVALLVWRYGRIEEKWAPATERVS